MSKWSSSYLHTQGIWGRALICCLKHYWPHEHPGPDDSRAPPTRWLGRATRWAPTILSGSKTQDVLGNATLQPWECELTERGWPLILNLQPHQEAVDKMMKHRIYFLTVTGVRFNSCDKHFQEPITGASNPSSHTMEPSAGLVCRMRDHELWVPLNMCSWKSPDV